MILTIYIDTIFLKGKLAKVTLQCSFGLVETV